MLGLQFQVAEKSKRMRISQGLSLCPGKGGATLKTAHNIYTLSELAPVFSRSHQKTADSTNLGPNDIDYKLSSH